MIAFMSEVTKANWDLGSRQTTGSEPVKIVIVYEANDQNGSCGLLVCGENG